MIPLVLIYKGRIGFQPADLTLTGCRHMAAIDTVPDSFDRYIHNGRLTFDMTVFNPNYGMFNDLDPINAELNSPYVVWKWFVWDRMAIHVDHSNKHATALDHLNMKSKVSERQMLGLRLRKGRTHIIWAAEISSTEQHILSGIMATNPSLKQIDDALQHFMIGSGRPMIWDTIPNVWRKIKASEKPEMSKIDFLESLVEELPEDVLPVPETKTKRVPKRRKKKTSDSNTPFLE